MNKKGYRIRIIIFVMINIMLMYFTYPVSGRKMIYEKDDRILSVNARERSYVIPCGCTMGIYIKTKGVLVLDTQKIEAVDGRNYEPAKNILQAGDYILEMNGQKIDSRDDIYDGLKKMKQKECILQVLREDKKVKVKVEPVAAMADGQYKLGVWIREDTQGLGTLTYIMGDDFGALGHGISDIDTEEQMKMERGTLYKADLYAIEKGKRGKPGEIIGKIFYKKENRLGEIRKNTECGIYGTIYCVDQLIRSYHLDERQMPAASKEEVKNGKAYIKSDISGKTQLYEIKIERVNPWQKDQSKGIKIRITDPKLLEMSNGILQGMSGSPILQDGKIVGAVTHVFVNDPAKGFGIFIDTMLEQQ